MRLVSRLHYIVVWVDHAEYRLVPRHKSLGTRLRTVRRIGELSIDLFFCDGIRRNSHHAGIQRDSSFYGDLGEWRDILIRLLVGVELGKYQKLKQLYKCLPIEFSINIAYDAIDILSSRYTKMAAQG